jgi:hypothetical protein
MLLSFTAADSDDANVQLPTPENRSVILGHDVQLPGAKPSGLATNTLYISSPE